MLAFDQINLFPYISHSVFVIPLPLSHGSLQKAQGSSALFSLGAKIPQITLCLL